MPAASSSKTRRSAGAAPTIAATRPWLTIADARAPVAMSANRVCTSRARASRPLTRNTLPTPRSILRLICKSGASWNGGGARPRASSRVSVTSARLRLGRLPDPAKITSSISPPRRLLAELSPIAQRSASTTLDLPHPFGPTMPVSPGKMSIATASAKLLKPAIRSRVRLTGKHGLRAVTAPRHPSRRPRTHRRTTRPLPCGRAPSAR